MPHIHEAGTGDAIQSRSRTPHSGEGSERGEGHDPCPKGYDCLRSCRSAHHHAPFRFLEWVHEVSCRTGSSAHEAGWKGDTISPSNLLQRRHDPKGHANKMIGFPLFANGQGGFIRFPAIPPILVGGWIKCHPIPVEFGIIEGKCFVILYSMQTNEGRGRTLANLTFSRKILCTKPPSDGEISRISSPSR